MIINLITNFVLLLFGMIFVFFPKVTIADIPLVGAPFSEYFSGFMDTWYTILTMIPYLQDVWFVLLWVILPFEIGLLVMKFFLGHRMPAHV